MSKTKQYFACCGRKNCSEICNSQSSSYRDALISVNCHCFKIVTIKRKEKSREVVGEALRDDTRGQIEETKAFVCKDV